RPVGPAAGVPADRHQVRPPCRRRTDARRPPPLSPYVATMVTRRFADRPIAVRFDATGLALPRADALNSMRDEPSAPSARRRKRSTTAARRALSWTRIPGAPRSSL